MYFMYFQQKPMSISQLKRNPFKKTPQSSGKVVSNQFKHLTESALGFDSQETQDIDFDNLPLSTNSTATNGQVNGKENSSTENNSPKPAVNIQKEKYRYYKFIS